MKTMTITDIMADFLDSIRAYEHESGKSIHFDERESSEFVDIYFNNEGKLKAEKQELLSVCEHQMAELWYVNEDGEPFQLEHQSKCFICGYEDNSI